MTIDSIIFQNIEHLIETTGVTEHQCVLSCRLNSNFFTNYKKGKTKHFKICDIVEIARFFDVDISYLCDFGNARDDFFMPRYKLNKRDEKTLLAAFKRLDPVGRIMVADAINAEIENTKIRNKAKK